MKDWEYDTAGDHGLGPGEKLKSLKREAGLPARISQSCWAGCWCTSSRVM